MLLRENLQNIEKQKKKKIQPPVNQFSIVRGQPGIIVRLFF